MNIKICVSHRIDKNSYSVCNDFFLPVLCGAKYLRDTLHMQGDNTGDNISDRRLSLGEFTVEYWMWKNVKADYYGLLHYRRYFSLSDQYFKRNHHNIIVEWFLNKRTVQKHDIDNCKKIRQLCENFDLIIPEPTDVRYVHHGEDITTVRELWEYEYGRVLPNGIIDVFLEVLKEINFSLIDDAYEYMNGYYHIGYNCFITRHTVFCDMCEFIFDTLSVLDKKYGNLLCTDKYPRTLGYLCEIMFGIFVYNAKKTIKYKELPLVFFEETAIDMHLIDKIALYGFKSIKSIVKTILPVFVYNSVKSFLKKVIDNFNKLRGIL